jgi:ADP-dependent NAD(P)H-hydrate dehydratase / NAD(P)H-hydrate epimerase
MLIVTAEEMRALDREVIDTIGVPGAVLMEAAGRAVAERVRALAPRGEVVVYAGPGNNGGDGFVAARHLMNWGIATRVLLWADRHKIRGDAHLHLVACEKTGVCVLNPGAPEETADAAVVVDALLGTGLDREVTGPLADAIARINGHRAVKVAVDIPSGLHADRGVPMGTCVRADHTVTFAFAKRGLVGAPGFTYAGKLEVADIGIPEWLARARGVTSRLLDDKALAPMVRPLDPLAHKGTRGHLLILAGSVGKSGAALLCGSAALRGGAGLVTLAAPFELMPVVDGRVLELMTSWYHLPPEPTVLLAALEGKRALAAGPGMPSDPAMREVLQALARRAADAGIGLVLDADALNHLAAMGQILDARPPVVLTPHPGEAARLLGRTTADVQADRVAAAEELAAKFAAVVVLKGARTVIACSSELAICPTGGPQLGSGGTGDVLTGLVGALLAQGIEPFEAACAAVYAHGLAGDRAGGNLVAHDLLAHLPKRQTSPLLARQNALDDGKTR